MKTIHFFKNQLLATFALGIMLLPLSSYAHNGSPDHFEHIAVEPDPASQGRQLQNQPYFAIFVTTYDDVVASDYQCSLREAIQLVNYSYADNFSANFEHEDWQESITHFGTYMFLLGECPKFLLQPEFTDPRIMDFVRPRMPRGQWALYTDRIQSWIILQEGEYTIDIIGKNEEDGWTGDLDIHAYPGKDVRIFNEEGQQAEFPAVTKFCTFSGTSPINPSKQVVFKPETDCGGGIGIVGAGSALTTINANGLDRIFDHHREEFNDGYRKNNFYVSGVHLTGGLADGKGYDSEESPYSNFGGGVLSKNSILIEKTSFSLNQASNGGALALIGRDGTEDNVSARIANESYFKDLIFIGNFASLKGGSAYIKNVNLSDHNFESNPNWNNLEHLDKLQFLFNYSALDGGAVYSDLSYLHFKRSSFFMNASLTAAGGAIYNHGYLAEYLVNNRVDWRPKGGELKLENTAFTANIAATLGGAIVDLSFRAASINHSTLFLNFAGVEAGAIYNEAAYQQVINNTPSLLLEAQVNLKSTIMTQNFTYKQNVMDFDDCVGKIVSYGQNIISSRLLDLNCLFEEQATDLFATNPLLELQPSLPVLPRLNIWSPAIDMSDNLDIEGHLVQSDLLGSDRELDLGFSRGAFKSDSGAHEYQAIFLNPNDERFPDPHEFAVNISQASEKMVSPNTYKNAKQKMVQDLSKSAIPSLLKSYRYGNDYNLSIIEVMLNQ